MDNFLGKIQKNRLFSELTTLEIGGPAKKFVIVKSEEDLTSAINQLTMNPEPFLVIGDGSNLLVSDDGFDGLVIKNEVKGIANRQDPELVELEVQAGTQLQELVDYTIEHGLGGLHKLTGIPGTVGGAIFGNAGAFGQTISDYIVSVTTLDTTTHNLKPTTLSKDDCGFDYRESTFKRNNYIILEAHFSLPSSNPQTLKQEAQEVLEKRLKKYPPGILCPGSFFKNLILNKLPKEVQNKIPKDRDYFGKVPAWYFLDEVGAKGAQIGNIKIADFHGNLFINLGGGIAKDFYTLAKIYFDKVRQQFGISLEPEVQLINLPKLDQT